MDKKLDTVEDTVDIDSTSTDTVDIDTILQEKYNSIKKMYEWGFSRNKTLEFVPKNTSDPVVISKTNEYIDYFFPRKGKPVFVSEKRPAPSYYAYTHNGTDTSNENEEEYDDTTIEELAHSTIQSIYDRGEDRAYCLTFVEELAHSPTSTPEFTDALYKYVDIVYPVIQPTPAEHYSHKINIAPVNIDTIPTPTKKTEPVRKIATTPKGTIVMSRATPGKAVCKPSYSDSDAKK